MKILFLLILLITLAFAQNSIIGKWKTIDDETGKPKSIVEIYEKGGKFYGKIIELFREPNEDQDPICTKCEDYRKNQKIKGMVIITNMIQKDNYYEDGEILDPKKGKIYKCKLWVENGLLKVRGYWGFIYRTQTWYPVK
ncbi:MAG TPA: DUF2147 domain-containing protein [Ignavibacteriales bacterium]|nr:DUF2147 domain-containing protein [Ignavibacteriales bacterium]HOL81152.1 DUF2147 domain-containing protein [Ignavibacteriales bacterium]HOM65255.1 DUF2147 domain-containing protein [Ignavibacteriales bacterium]HPD66547.1 DUF2147 domain-containing protein [Ignavibacteriales bacterium]HPP33492.1 DUF2147 domain-containing protein [Ignavibacteriales bacterium]